MLRATSAMAIEVQIYYSLRRRSTECMQSNENNRPLHVREQSRHALEIDLNIVPMNFAYNELAT